MNNMYKVYNDTSHFVGVKYLKVSNNQNNEYSLKDYKSEFALYNNLKSNKNRSSSNEENDIDIIMKEAYVKSLELKEKDRLMFMLKFLEENNYCFPEIFVKNYIKKMKTNLYYRVDRFRKKALNNNWNYFVTITYDDLLHTEESFKEKLKKCLANLHTRNGYKYMGVFERSKTGRLHFHALMYIPNGEMKGEINKIKDYSTSDNKIRVAHINTFFEKRFGRNDFISINMKSLMKDNTINYLLKYIGKSDEPIFYSRGIPTYLFIELPDDEIISSFGDMIIKYVLSDDVLENHTTIKMRC